VPLEAVVWEDRAARVLLSTDLLARTAGALERPLRVLDIGSGRGLSGVAALKSPHVDLVVAVDVDPDAVAASARNAARNGVAAGYHALRFDVCDSPDELLSLVRARAPQRPLGFDVITMSVFTVLPEVVANCVFELIYAVASESTIYIDSDSVLFQEEFYSEFLRSQGRNGVYPSLPDFAKARRLQLDKLTTVDVSLLVGSDEPPMLATLPVHVWLISSAPTFNDPKRSMLAK